MDDKELLDIGEQLIRLGVVQVVGHGSGRELVGVRLHPVNHRFMIDTRKACNPAIVDAVHTLLHGLLAQSVGIAMFMRLRRIFPPTVLTFPTLTPGGIFPFLT